MHVSPNFFLAKLKFGPLPTPTSNMYTTYFQHRPRDSPVEWTSDCPEATILDTYLSAQLDAKAAAKRLTPPSQDPTEKVGDKQWRLWNLILDVAAELPQTQPDLVVLLEAFGTLENPGNWAIDWSRLGSFGSVWRDAWECACLLLSYSVRQAGHFSNLPFSAFFYLSFVLLISAIPSAFSTHRLTTSPPPSSSPFIPPPPSDRWINFNAFSARLVAASVDNVSVVFGFFLLRDALEETLSGAAKEVEPRAAAQWILQAGSAVFKAENEQVDEGGHWARGLAKESQLWRGGVGFGRARWEFWRARFEELEMEGEGEGEGKGDLKEAARKMREIEEGVGG